MIKYEAYAHFYGDNSMDTDEQEKAYFKERISLLEQQVAGYEHSYKKLLKAFRKLSDELTTISEYSPTDKKENNGSVSN